MAGMKKTHYVAIAETINRQRTDIDGVRFANPVIHDTLTYLAEDLADVFAGMNPEFDRTRFLAIAGVEPEEQETES